MNKKALGTKVRTIEGCLPQKTSSKILSRITSNKYNYKKKSTKKDLCKVSLKRRV